MCVIFKYTFQYQIIKLPLSRLGDIINYSYMKFNTNLRFKKYCTKLLDIYSKYR